MMNLDYSVEKTDAQVRITVSRGPVMGQIAFPRVMQKKVADTLEKAATAVREA